MNRVFMGGSCKAIYLALACILHTLRMDELPLLPQPSSLMAVARAFFKGL